MTELTKPIRIPANLEGQNRVLLGLLQAIADRVDKPRMSRITDTGVTISNPPTQTEVAVLAAKIDEILASLREVSLLEPEP